MDFITSRKFVIPLLTFLIVSHPMLYKLMRSVLGKWVADSDGMPTTYGILLHSVVFALIANILWPYMGIRVFKLE